MDIVLTLLYYIFTVVESVWILHCLRIGIKNLHLSAYGFAALLVFEIIGHEKVDLNTSCTISSILSFIIVFLIIDKEIVTKIESTVLAILMKNCVLLSVEVWCVEGKWLDVGSNYLDTINYYVTELLIIILFGFVLSFILNSIDGEKKLTAGSRLDYVILIGCFDIFLCIFYLYKLIQISYLQGFFIKLMTSFAGLSLLLLEINILYKKWLTERVKQSAKAEHELYETQRNYYLSLLDKEADTKKYRHDMNNHMICIKALLDEENYPELQKYIDNLYDKTSFLVNKGHKTGNSIIDALTNYYVESLDKEIDFKLKGNIVKDINIDDISLSSIYSNMIVNAIEAQKYIPAEREKYISVTLKEGYKYAQIIVKNAMVEEKIADVEKIETTKIDRDNHGYGLTNIKRNVAEYNGRLVIEAEDYEFCITATLPLKEHLDA